ncbi:MAG: DUF6599 family protein [Terriglobia bacterium]
MRFARGIGFCCFTLALASGSSLSSDTLVTTIKLFPSPKEILNKLADTSAWRPKGPMVGIESLRSPNLSLPVSASLLKECGFRSYWEEGFERGHRAVAVQVFELGDSSGAYSLYSIQVQPGGHAEAIGDQCTTGADDLWLWQANLVVHVIDQNASGKVRTQLLEIAREISSLIRQRAELPNLVKRLPFHNQVSGTYRYTLGPQGFAALKIPLEFSRLGLEMGAEVSMAKYQFSSSEGLLMLLNYPTPQMARKYYSAMQDTRSLWVNPPSGGTVFTKRSGPLIALLWGTLNEGDANTLLQTIQYTADLTWDKVPPGEEIAAYVRRVRQSILLTGALLLVTFGTGVVFGLIRVAVKRWVPISIFDRPEEVELTQLRLLGRSIPPPPTPPSTK